MASAPRSPEADSTDTTAADTLSAAVVSVPRLINAKKHGGADLRQFGRARAAIVAQPTQTLIVRLHTTAEPLTLWMLHLELDKRDVPPCLRWPANDDTPQAEFITLLADLLWLTKRHPGHKAVFRGWRGAFSHTPATAEWHKAIHRQYLFVASRYSVAHHCAKGLGLSDAQRHDLMVMQTNGMRADRQYLHGVRFQALVECLHSHAVERPDKAGKVAPAAVATRRAMIWRTYLLAGRSQTRAAAYWSLIAGEQVSRQAIAKQVATVADVLRVERRQRPGA